MAGWDLTPLGIQLGALIPEEAARNPALLEIPGFTHGLLEVCHEVDTYAFARIIYLAPHSHIRRVLFTRLMENVGPETLCGHDTLVKILGWMGGQGGSTEDDVLFMVRLWLESFERRFKATASSTLCAKLIDDIGAALLRGWFTSKIVREVVHLVNYFPPSINFSLRRRLKVASVMNDSTILYDMGLVGEGREELGSIMEVWETIELCGKCEGELFHRIHSDISPDKRRKFYFGLVINGHTTKLYSLPFVDRDVLATAIRRHVLDMSILSQTQEELDRLLTIADECAPMGLREAMRNMSYRYLRGCTTVFVKHMDVKWGVCLAHLYVIANSKARRWVMSRECRAFREMRWTKNSIEGESAFWGERPFSIFAREIDMLYRGWRYRGDVPTDVMEALLEQMDHRGLTTFVENTEERLHDDIISMLRRKFSTVDADRIPSPVQALIHSPMHE